MNYKGGLLVIFCLAVTMLGISLYIATNKSKECDAKGGVLVQTPAGWACVKLEKL